MERTHHPLRAAGTASVPRRRRGRSIAAAAVVITLAGCGGPGDGPEPAATSGAPSQETCEQLFDAEPGEGPDLVVLVDPTRDSPPSALPTSAARKVEQTAQAGGTVTLLGVDGADAAPLVILDHASLMDPAAGSARARRIAALAPSCVERQIAGAVPTAAGSDQLRALQEVARRTAEGGEALVLGNGVSTAGTLDMTRLPVVQVDAAAVAQAVPASEVPQGTGRTFTFYGLGEVDPPLSQTARSWVADVAMELCRRSGATCERSDEVGERLPTTGRGAVPQDGQVAWPSPEKVQLPDGGVRTDVPAELLFAFGSAQLSPEAPAVVASVAADLGAARTLEVVGHTDSACPADPRVCRDLSLQRAQAVADLLRQDWSGPVPEIAVDGVGPDDPLVDDRDESGGLVPAAAARNRRVSITAR